MSTALGIMTAGSITSLTLKKSSVPSTAKSTLPTKPKPSDSTSLKGSKNTSKISVLASQKTKSTNLGADKRVVGNGATTLPKEGSRSNTFVGVLKKQAFSSKKSLPGQADNGFYPKAYGQPVRNMYESPNLGQFSSQQTKDLDQARALIVGLSPENGSEGHRITINKGPSSAAHPTSAKLGFHGFKTESLGVRKPNGLSVIQGNFLPQKQDSRSQLHANGIHQKSGDILIKEDAGYLVDASPTTDTLRYRQMTHVLLSKDNKYLKRIGKKNNLFDVRKMTERTVTQASHPHPDLKLVHSLIEDDGFSDASDHRALKGLYEGSPSRHSGIIRQHSSSGFYNLFQLNQRADTLEDEEIGENSDESIQAADIPLVNPKLVSCMNEFKSYLANVLESNKQRINKKLGTGTNGGMGERSPSNVTTLLSRDGTAVARYTLGDRRLPKTRENSLHHQNGVHLQTAESMTPSPR